MNDLIEAFTIFAKYNNVQFPTHCEHDVIYVMDVTWNEMSVEDRARLDALGFTWNDNEGWHSYRFGSA